MTWGTVDRACKGVEACCKGEGLHESYVMSRYIRIGACNRGFVLENVLVRGGGN